VAVFASIFRHDSGVRISRRNSADLAFEPALRGDAATAEQTPASGPAGRTCGRDRLVGLDPAVRLGERYQPASHSHDLSARYVRDHLDEHVSDLLTEL